VGRIQVIAGIGVPKGKFYMPRCDILGLREFQGSIGQVTFPTPKIVIITSKNTMSIRTILEFPEFSSLNLYKVLK